jgi:hypothetical protein
MHEFSVEWPQTWDFEPSYIIRSSTGSDENIRIIFKCLIRFYLFYFQFPDLLWAAFLSRVHIHFHYHFLPCHPKCNLRLCVTANMSHNTIFLCDFVQIFTYFCRMCVKGWPGRIRLESVLVGMCYHGLHKNLHGTVIPHFEGLQGISQAQPRYLFSHQVPPIPSFFSYIWKSIFRSLWGILTPRCMPE